MLNKERKKIIYKTTTNCLAIYIFTISILSLILWDFEIIFATKTLTLANIFIFIFALRKLKRRNLLTIKTILVVSLIINIALPMTSLIVENWLDIKLYLIFM